MGFLYKILCDFLSAILDNFPEALPSQDCHKNTDVPLDDYTAMDNSRCSFGAPDQEGTEQPKWKPQRGYLKTLSFNENE
jgi:hypothetical protein